MRIDVNNLDELEDLPAVERIKPTKKRFDFPKENEHQEKTRILVGNGFAEFEKQKE